MPRNKIEDLPEARLLKYQPVVAPPIAKWFLLLCFAKVLQVHFFSIDLPDSAQRSTQHPSLTAEKKKKKKSRTSSQEDRRTKDDSKCPSSQPSGYLPLLLQD